MSPNQHTLLDCWCCATATAAVHIFFLTRSTLCSLREPAIAFTSPSRVGRRTWHVWLFNRNICFNNKMLLVAPEPMGYLLATHILPTTNANIRHTEHSRAADQCGAAERPDRKCKFNNLLVVARVYRQRIFIKWVALGVENRNWATTPTKKKNPSTNKYRLAHVHYYLFVVHLAMQREW